MGNAVHADDQGADVLIKIPDQILKSGRDLLVLCAGWKNKFNLEDTLFAGALAEKVLGDPNYYTICDATLGAMDLYEAAKGDMMAYLEKVAQRHRLKKNNLDDVIGYCHEFDLTDLIPVLEENYLLALRDMK